MERNISDITLDTTQTGMGVSNPTIELSTPIVENSQSINLSTPNTGRIAANISDLKTTTDKDPVGIIVKTSIEDDILGEGGPFDKMIDRKAKEMKELNDMIDAHNTAVAMELGEEVPEEITDADVERSKNVNVNSDIEKISSIEGEEDYIDELEKELSEDTSKPVQVPVSEVSKSVNIEPEKTVDPSSVSFNVDEDDFKELEEDEEDTNTDEEDFKNLQAEITQKIIPVSKKLNIASFTRAKKVVRANDVVRNLTNKVADWALMSSGKKISMSEFSGSSIDALSNTSGMSNVSIVNKRYKIFYDHLISENKPNSLEEFAKSLSFFDNDHLYMAAYIASFADANYIPIDCPKCKSTFLTDNLPINSLYKFEDEKSEERFNAIMRGEYGEVDEFYVTEEVPISDRICIVFREPSVYKMLFETSYLDEKFARKYDAIISVLAYIDEILWIDEENQQLIPVDFKRFPNNKVKDIKSRIIEYSKIINQLPADQYNIIVAYINAINKIKGTVSYQIPETVCPKCGNIIPATPISAEGLVFMRHQLAALATTSIN